VVVVVVVGNFSPSVSPLMIGHHTSDNDTLQYRENAVRFVFERFPRGLAPGLAPKPYRPSFSETFQKQNERHFHGIVMYRCPRCDAQS
jgi:hypothetical protein